MARKQHPRINWERVTTLTRFQRPDGSNAFGIDTGAISEAPPLGRRPGSGLADEDDSLIAEMTALLLAGKARNRTDAARQVAGRAMGGGTFESKVARLVRRYDRERIIRDE